MIPWVKSSGIIGGRKVNGLYLMGISRMIIVSC